MAVLLDQVGRGRVGIVAGVVVEGTSGGWVVEWNGMEWARAMYFWSAMHGMPDHCPRCIQLCLPDSALPVRHHHRESSLVKYRLTADATEGIIHVDGK